jgi:hypothetical protein
MKCSLLYHHHISIMPSDRFNLLPLGMLLLVSLCSAASSRALPSPLLGADCGVHCLPPLNLWQQCRLPSALAEPSILSCQRLLGKWDDIFSQPLGSKIRTSKADTPVYLKRRWSPSSMLCAPTNSFQPDRKSTSSLSVLTPMFHIFPLGDFKATTSEMCPLKLFANLEGTLCNNSFFLSVTKCFFCFTRNYPF